MMEGLNRFLEGMLPILVGVGVLFVATVVATIVKVRDSDGEKTKSIKKIAQFILIMLLISLYVISPIVWLFGEAFKGDYSNLLWLGSLGLILYLANAKWSNHLIEQVIRGISNFLSFRNNSVNIQDATPRISSPGAARGLLNVILSETKYIPQQEHMDFIRAKLNSLLISQLGKKDTYWTETYRPLVELADKAKTPDEFFSNAHRAIDDQEAIRDKTPLSSPKLDPPLATTGFMNINVDWIFNWIPKLMKKIYHRFKFVFAAIALAIIFGGIYWLSIPHTYQDCILKNLKGTQNQMAVREIRSACRKKYR